MFPFRKCRKMKKSLCLQIMSEHSEQQFPKKELSAWTELSLTWSKTGEADSEVLLSHWYSRCPLTMASHRAKSTESSHWVFKVIHWYFHSRNSGMFNMKRIYMVGNKKKNLKYNYQKVFLFNRIKQSLLQLSHKNVLDHQCYILKCKIIQIQEQALSTSYQELACLVKLGVEIMMKIHLSVSGNNNNNKEHCSSSPKPFICVSVLSASSWSHKWFWCFLHPFHLTSLTLVVVNIIFLPFMPSFDSRNGGMWERRGYEQQQRLYYQSQTIKCFCLPVLSSSNYETR